MMPAFATLELLYDGLLDAIASSVATKDGEFHLALSGGSTPVGFFRFWAAHPEACDLNRVRFWWVDERCVPPDDARSNYGVAYKELLEPLHVSPEHIHWMRGELPPMLAAKQYGESLESALAGAPLDFALLGMGPDGHIASIFPGGSLNCPHPLAGVAHSPDGLPRISLAMDMLARTTDLNFLVTGEAKRSLAEAVISGTAGGLPASILFSQRPDARWWLAYNK